MSTILRSSLQLSALVVVLFCASCNGNKQSTPASNSNVAAQPPYLTEYRKKIRELEVECQKLGNSVAALRQKKEKEEKESKGEAPEKTQKEFAEAQVDYKNAMAELLTRFQKLETDMKAMGKPTELTPETIKMIVDIIAKEKQLESDPTKKDTVTSTTTSTATPGGDIGEEFKSLLKAAGAALCAVQPEICPLLGPIFAALGLFGSTEERQAFLEAIGSQGAGTPLTDAQSAAVRQAVEKGYSNMDARVRKLIDQMADKDKTIHKAVGQAVKALVDELGITKEQYDALLSELSSKKSEEEKFQAIQAIYVVFPNPLVKKKIVNLVKQLGAPKLAVRVEAEISVK